MAIIKQKTRNVVKDVEQRELLFTVSTATINTVWKFPKKLKIELPHDPTIPLMDIYLKEMKTPIKNYMNP